MPLVQNPNVKVGIIGGMGPDASDNFVERYRAACKQELSLHGQAWKDQLSPAMFYTTEPVPDRTTAILEERQTGQVQPAHDPYPLMSKMALECAANGVTHAVVVCNTAHYWLDRLKQDHPYLTFVSLIDTTVDALKAKGIHKVGLMATRGSVESGVYQKALAKAGIECLPIPEGWQDLTMKGIYEGVKANNYPLAKQCLETVARENLNAGVEALILGCTEIPEAGLSPDVMARSVDPNQLAAEALAHLSYQAEAPLPPTNGSTLRRVG
jgi:aspartate racemase